MQGERTSPAWTLTAVTKGRRRATLKTDGGWAARRCGGIQGGLDEVASMPRSPQWRHSEASKKCGRCAECPPAPGCQPYCSPSCQRAHWRIEHREVYPPAGWRGDSQGHHARWASARRGRGRPVQTVASSRRVASLPDRRRVNSRTTDQTVLVGTKTVVSRRRPRLWRSDHRSCSRLPPEG